MKIVKFPVRQRAFQRLGVSGRDLRTSIDTELRKIDASIAALRAVRASLLVEYRQELYAAVEVIAEVSGLSV